MKLSAIIKIIAALAVLCSQVAGQNTFQNVQVKGNIGIGTTVFSPSNPLHVYDASAGIAQKIESDGSYVEQIFDGTRTGSSATLVDLTFKNAGTTVGTINVNTGGVNDAGNMIFNTKPTGGSNTNRMEILSTGFIGMGTGASVDPSYELHVYQPTSTPEAIVQTTGSGQFFARVGAYTAAGDISITGYDNNYSAVAAYAANGVLEAGPGFGGMVLAATHATHGNIMVYSGGNASTNQRMYVDYGGNIGVGNSSTFSAAARPNRDLHIKKAASSYVTIENTAGTTSAMLLGATSTGSTAMYSRATDTSATGRDFNFYSGSTNTLTILADGKVGIGSAAPTSELSFGATTTTMGMDTIDASDNKTLIMTGGGAASISRGGYLAVRGNEVASTSGSFSMVAGNVSTGTIRMYTGAGIERLTILSDGKVGIGEATPDTALDVTGAITQAELSADPADPDEGHSVTWQSDGTGAGDDGDIMMKITAGAVTRTLSMVDYSGLETATLAAAATTFDSGFAKYIKVNGDAGGNTIATITGGQAGQRLVLHMLDTNTDITDTDAATANTINLSTPFTGATNEMLELINDGTKWHELERTQN